MLNVHISYFCRSTHIQGVVCGFLMLRDKGLAQVSFDDKRNIEKAGDIQALLLVDVDGKKIVYDLNDGYVNNEKTIKLYTNADYIFKRSFSNNSNMIYPAPIRQKIFPLGLNYQVAYPNAPVNYRRSSIVRDWISYFVSTPCYLKDFEATINTLPQNPKILFMTRLWSPLSPEIKDNLELQENWKKISENRVQIAREIKKRFGNKAYCGMFDSSYARDICPDLILPRFDTLKRVYLHRMKRTPICVSSIGLHGSTGWRTAEFVAAGRAIVTEKMEYDAPGDFCEGKNFFSFSTAEECISKIENLVDNPQLILEMSKINTEYYQEWLRPDMQVFRSLEIANCI